MINLNNLNGMQKKAVETVDGPVLVVAGAGSGKTRALTSRIYNLIKNHNVNQQNILAITFTNRATREMKERLQEVDNGMLQISTFHSFCARLLRQYIHNFEGYNRYFTIYGDAEKTRVIKRLIKDFKFSQDDLHKQILQNISTAKNDGISPEKFEETYMYVRNLNETVKVYHAYEENLQRNNALDFDDLLSKTYELLLTNVNVLTELQQKFKYIHIDEFQDTNKVQYKIVKLLAGEHKNLFVVGDEDQSIYAWRGASLENTNLFVKEFNPKIIKLEKNYRSTKSILDHANKLISHNKSRIEKKLYTDNEDPHTVKYYKAYSDHDEAEHVVRRIYDLINYDKVNPNEIAILFRMGALSRLFEEKLINYNIPYKLYGGFKFFDRVEVRNVLSYLWLIYNPNDNESVKQIINYPRRAIGKTSVDRLDALSKETNKSIFELVLDVENQTLPKALSRKLLKVKDIFEAIQQIDKNGSMSDSLKTILSLTGIIESYDESVEEDYDRLLNIGQLEESVLSFENLNPDAALIDYLESVSLQAEDSGLEEAAESVKVSTVHAAKGLEFMAVFVVGAEENLFPISRALASEEEIEEERRLMYVAITRSKKFLVITSADNRYLYSSRSNMIPSRFLGEMGLVKVRKPSRTTKQSGYVSFKGASFAGYDINALSATSSTDNKNTKESEKPMPQVVNTYTDNDLGFSSNLKGLMSEKLQKQASKFEEFVVGIKVFHPKFGVGTITKSDVNEGDKNIAVQFDKVGTKMLNLEFAPLNVMKNKEE